MAKIKNYDSEAGLSYVAVRATKRRKIDVPWVSLAMWVVPGVIFLTSAWIGCCVALMVLIG